MRSSVNHTRVIQQSEQSLGGKSSVRVLLLDTMGLRGGKPPRLWVRRKIATAQGSRVEKAPIVTLGTIE